MAASMSEALRRQTALDIYNKTGKLFTSLFERWLDEREFESIADYQKVLASAIRKVTAAAKVTKMTKRPFGYEYTLGGCTYAVTLKTKGVRNVYEYRRVA